MCYHKNFGASSQESFSFLSKCFCFLLFISLVTPLIGLDSHLAFGKEEEKVEESSKFECLKNAADTKNAALKRVFDKYSESFQEHNEAEAVAEDVVYAVAISEAKLHQQMVSCDSTKPETQSVDVVAQRVDAAVKGVSDFELSIKDLAVFNLYKEKTAVAEDMGGEEKGEDDAKDGDDGDQDSMSPTAKVQYHAFNVDAYSPDSSPVSQAEVSDFE